MTAFEWDDLPESQIPSWNDVSVAVSAPRRHSFWVVRHPLKLSRLQLEYSKHHGSYCNRQYCFEEVMVQGEGAVRRSNTIPTFIFTEVNDDFDLCTRALTPY